MEAIASLILFIVLKITLLTKNNLIRKGQIYIQQY